MTKLDPYAQFLADLKRKRQSKKMTQAQVAEGIKLSRAQYTAIEKGRSLVNWRHLHALSKVLGTSFTIKAT
jgi:transcriptional regulator with XRE-family HTH domain